MPRGNDLIRGAADLLVLSVLADGPLYGYAIAKNVSSRSEGHIRLTPGVLYPLLHQMEKQGLVLASWDGGDSGSDDADEAASDDGESSGRKRKWYRLSKKGWRRLEQRVNAHRTYVNVIESFLPAPDTGGATG